MIRHQPSHDETDPSCWYNGQFGLLASPGLDNEELRVTRIAEISFGSFDEWLAVLKGVVVWVSVSAVLGVVVGCLCRGRAMLALALSLAVSVAHAV